MSGEVEFIPTFECHVEDGERSIQLGVTTDFAESYKGELGIISDLAVSFGNLNRHDIIEVFNNLSHQSVSNTPQVPENG